MAITGTFLADFSQFDSATKGAEKNLESFSSQADKVGGRLMDLGTKGGQAAPQVSTLSSQFKNFDSALAAAGVHIGPQIKGIEEIGAAAGKTASQFGMLGTAGLVLAAAMTGWQIGRVIADLTGADKFFEDIGKKIFGMGDEAQRAGARADILALATKNAKREITDVNEAIKINAQAAADQALAWGKTTNAMRDSSIAIAGWQREIRQVRKDGNFEQLTADMESQNFSLEKLSKKYGVHVEALQYLQRQMAATAKTEQEAAAISERAATAAAAAQKEAIAFQQLRWKQQLEMETNILASTAKQTAAYLELTNNAVLKEFQAQQELNAVVTTQATLMDKLNLAQQALQATKIAGFSIAAQESRLMKQFGQDQMTEAVADEKKRFALAGANTEVAKMPAIIGPATSSVLAMGSAAQQTATNFFSMSAELHNAIRAAQAMDELAGRDKGIYGATIGGIGGSSPSLRWGQASTVVNINGSVLGNKNEIARVVGDAVTSSYRTGGNRLPV